MVRALIILDMMNTFDFPEKDLLFPKALKAARKIKALKEKCRKKKVPVIYVNDNFGNWNSNWTEIYKKCVEQKCMGKPIAEILKPDQQDYFVLKPKHSGFYSTVLELLLQDLGIDTLIICGIAGNICVLFTANDAHMREYQVVIPKDCIASNTDKDDQFALYQFKEVFKFHTPLSSSLRL